MSTINASLIASGQAKQTPPRVGRPLGARTVKETVDVEISRCPACDSTDRSEYFNLTTQEYAGERNGNRYTSIERRPCRCLTCGQNRIDITYPYDPAKWVGES